MSTQIKPSPLLSRRKFLAEATTFLGSGIAAGMMGVHPPLISASTSLQGGSLREGLTTEEAPTIFAEDLYLGYGEISRTQHKIGIHTFLGDCVLSTWAFDGEHEGARIAAAIESLPRWGGVVYTRGGDQELSSRAAGLSQDIFQDSEKPVKVILLAGVYSVQPDLTIPANITLEIQPGAMLFVGDGHTLTIKGNILAGLYHIFAGAGFVTFGHDDGPPRTVLAGRLHREIYPQWWGAKGDGIHDDQPAIQAAIDSLSDTDVGPGTGGTVFLPLGVYYLESNEIAISSCGITLRGEGGLTAATHRRLSTLVSGRCLDAIHVFSTPGGNTANIGIHDLNIMGQQDGQCGNGIYVEATAQDRAVIGLTISNVHVETCAENGIYFKGYGAVANVFNCHLDTIVAYANKQTGIKLEMVSQVYGSSWYCTHNLSHQVHISGRVVDNQVYRSSHIELHRISVANCTSGYALVFERSQNIQVYNLLTESVTGAGHILVKGCRSMDLMGGSIQQEGNIEGIVFEDTQPYFDSRLITISIPGWTKTNHPATKRIKFAGDAIREIHLGMHADGRFSPNDIARFPDGYPGEPHFQPTYVVGKKTLWRIDTPIPGGGISSQRVEAKGAAQGDPCMVGYTAELGPSIQLSAIVSGPNIVTVTLVNNGANPQGPFTGYLQVAVWKHDYQQPSDTYLPMMGT